MISICDVFFQFLVAVEIEIRKHFSVSVISNDSDNIKESALHGVSESEEVLYHWEIVSINWSAAETKELMSLVVNHYITVRGFSFAKAFMEDYKQSMSKSTQKSKGLRKTLNTTSNVSHEDV